ncbi:MAG: adenosylcobinamide-GDP ribazoletransferase, partial [Gammaproteobacteria bacterium]
MHPGSGGPFQRSSADCVAIPVLQSTAASSSGSRTSPVPEGMPAARRELIRLFAAIQFFTCLPVPAWVGHSEEHLRGAIHYLPVIGLLVGCTGAAALLLGSLLWPPLVAVIASTVATILLSGALHEDGLADAMDGFGGGRTRDQVLAIMKDPRIGVFGALALGLALLLKVACLQAVVPARAALLLVCGHALTRFGVVVLMSCLPYARETGPSRARPFAQDVSSLSIAVAALAAIAPLTLLGTPALGGAGAAAVVGGIWGLYLRRRLGGY